MLPYKKIRLFCIFFILLILSGVSYSSDETPDRKKPVIVASTSLIASLVRDISGDSFEILNILPPNACPGHFDLKPKDVLRFRKAALIISHQYQKDLHQALRSQVKEERRWLILPDEKALTIPEQYLRIGQWLLKSLGDRFPLQEADFNKHWLRSETDIKQISDDLKKTFKNKNTFTCPVIVAYHQKEFIGTWGFLVTGVFDSPGGDSFQDLKTLIENGSKAKAKAVVANQQTGDKQARVIAEKLGVPVISLSNFPGGEPGTSTYKELLRSNCLKLLKILE
jgi:zinc transport system substrate-binding protein